MTVNLLPESNARGHVAREASRERGCEALTGGYISLSRWCQETVVTAPRAVSMAVVTALLFAMPMQPATAQSVSALGEPQPQLQMQGPTKPMTPERLAWLKGRCSQLVAFFDYYGVSRGENSDGPRNHARIGAAIECQRTHLRTGIDTMAALLVRKSFVAPKPGAPAIEPEDTEAPDITNPTRPASRF